MAQELQVIVKQQPGQVTWNFEQLKIQLANIMKEYAGLIYTDESIATARSDVAGLRKLRTAVEDRRKDIRRKCLEPYDSIEKQAKELTSLIDKPIETISGQIKAYEEKQRREKRKLILDFIAHAFESLPDDIAEKLTEKVYDPKWENASTPKKSYTDAVEAACAQVLSEIRILDGIDGDFRDTVMLVYKRNLILADALQKANELNQQREMLKERDRIRREEESLAAQRIAQRQIESPEDKPNPHQTCAPQTSDEHDMPNADLPPNFPEQPICSPDDTLEKVVCIRGTKKQIAKIIGFITYAGATYKEVQ